MTAITTWFHTQRKNGSVAQFCVAVLLSLVVSYAGMQLGAAFSTPAAPSNAVAHR
jgi:hypothetical protein